jgi:hypothetical protein
MIDHFDWRRADSWNIIFLELSQRIGFIKTFPNMNHSTFSHQDCSKGNSLSSCARFDTEGPEEPEPETSESLCLEDRSAFMISDKTTQLLKNSDHLFDVGRKSQSLLYISKTSLYSVHLSIPAFGSILVTRPADNSIACGRDGSPEEEIDVLCDMCCCLSRDVR